MTGNICTNLKELYQVKVMKNVLFRSVKMGNRLNGISEGS